MPTLKPGKNFVPHCRMIIEPAVAFWPPYSFTPLYWGLLSRPFLEEPCPFLCAIAMLPLNQTLITISISSQLDQKIDFSYLKGRCPAIFWESGSKSGFGRYWACKMSFISPSESVPVVASFIFPSGVIKKLLGMYSNGVKGFGISLSLTAKIS